MLVITIEKKLIKWLKWGGIFFMLIHFTLDFNVPKAKLHVCSRISFEILSMSKIIFKLTVCLS